MSYLGCPRIHIAGLFYTNPGNLNNTVENFQASTPEQLHYDTGKYKNPSGVAQFWLEQCVVTSVVAPDGSLCSAAAGDALVGASVQSASPRTPISNGQQGYYDIAKIADLDPNMQFRSELYGLVVVVSMPGGGGFSGRIANPPQLRDLFFGRGDAGIPGLQLAVGTWHQRLTDVVWTDPSQPSPVYQALKAGGVTELDLKLAADMFQTDLSKLLSPGDIFGYGRLVGVIGPVQPGEPCQLVPGRSLYGSQTPGLSGRATLASGSPSGADYSRQLAEEAALENPSRDTFWNRTDCRVQDLPNGKAILLIDMAGSTPLAKRQKGKLDLGGQLSVGFYEAEAFTPLSAGTISLDSYFELGADTLAIKDCVWPSNSAVVQIELTVDERQKMARTPLAIRSGTRVMLAENQNGLYINADTVTTRLPANTSQVFDLWVFAYGVPQATLPSGLSLAPQLLIDNLKPVANAVAPTQLFSALIATEPSTAGKFALSLRTANAVTASEMPPLRKSMDSLLCFLKATGQTYVVGETNYQPKDCPPAPPLISLLFWQDLLVVAQPTWDENISPILSQYALLYPGMKGRLDISNLATVTAYRDALVARYRTPRTDPGFMPVVRDMSPATVDMMLAFLEQLGGKGGKS